MRQLLAVCTSAILMAGCATHQATTELPTQHYNCDGWVITLGPDSTASMFSPQGRHIQLEEAPAASGVRYIAHQGTWIHEQGGTVMASYEDQELAHCQPLLTSREWVVEDINAGGVIDRSHATLTFSEDGKLSGNTSCNRYFGEYQLRGDRLSFTPLGTTRMACPEALMNQEQRFLNALQAAERLSIDPTGALLLKGAGQQILAR